MGMVPYCGQVTCRNKTIKEQKQKTDTFNIPYVGVNKLFLITPSKYTHLPEVNCGRAFSLNVKS